MSQAAVELVETDASAGTAALLPFDEQTGFDVAAGVRTAYALRVPGSGLLRKTQAERVVGSAVLGHGELDLHIEPEFRAQGLGAAAAAQLLERAGAGPLTAWSHEDHPAARALAARFGFAAERTLLQLRLEGLGRFETRPPAAPQRAGGTRPPAAPQRAGQAKPGVRIDAFRPGADDAQWLALNARVFAWHPEQGRVTEQDLAQRIAEPWFRAEDFLIAREPSGAMVGYCWLKVERNETGEIYVIGVAPEAAGQGIGRTLMDAGLARLRERGCTSAELYVEADNAAAVHLYRALGFTEAKVHVQYTRR